MKHSPVNGQSEWRPLRAGPHVRMEMQAGNVRTSLSHTDERSYLIPPSIVCLCAHLRPQNRDIDESCMSEATAISVIFCLRCQKSCFRDGAPRAHLKNTIFATKLVKYCNFSPALWLQMSTHPIVCHMWVLAVGRSLTQGMDFLTGRHTP